MKDLQLFIAAVVGGILVIAGAMFLPQEVQNLGAATNFNSLIVNDDGADEDSRIEGDTDAELFVVDAGDDTVTANQFTQGGGVLQFTATSTQAARTVTAAELQDYSVIEIVSADAPALSLTIQATSSWTTLLPDTGDSRVWFLTNKHAAATTTTIAAGVGIILDEPDGQNVVIAGGNRARIECFRDSTTNIVCSVDEHIDAD